MAGEQEPTPGTGEQPTDKTPKKLDKKELAELAFSHHPHVTKVWVNVETQHFTINPRKKRGEVDLGSGWKEFGRDLTKEEEKEASAWEAGRDQRIAKVKQHKINN